MTSKKQDKKALRKKTGSSYRPHSTAPDTTAMNAAVYMPSASDSSSDSCSSSSSHDSGSSCDSGGF